jgi:hypothetical protein
MTGDARRGVAYPARRHQTNKGKPMNRITTVAAALTAAALLSACVFAPPVTTTTDSASITRMSEQAVATCGAGNVKEVNAKSFTCK